MSSAPEVIMSFSDVAHAIQLALAPGFLLTLIVGLAYFLCAVHLATRSGSSCQ